MLCRDHVIPIMFTCLLKHSVIKFKSKIKYPTCLYYNYIILFIYS